MPMMLWHRNAEDGDGGTPIGQQTFPKVRITPRLGDYPRAVPRYPFFLRQMPKLVHGRCGFEAAFIKCRLDRVDPRFDRSDTFPHEIVVCHPRSPWVTSPNNRHRAAKVRRPALGKTLSARQALSQWLPVSAPGKDRQRNACPEVRWRGSQDY